ncbi:ubiquinone anaerobic biosynthesis accessory factor UbiT [Marinimicrobium koreense]|uniref:ubiquinone anaerobic biosynthesis accessory factor UbiT n=1 Tax=Marinimicrobium koreense TaxID=306545 RepID=UPI003F722C29
MTTMQSRSASVRPSLPRLIQCAKVAQPLIPEAIRRHTLGIGLNHTFSEALRRGELDFLHSRQARITVPDINLDFAVTLLGQRLHVSLKPVAPDVTFRADTRSLLQIMAGQVDPDTLFFRRKLAIEGDTELGLALKNFLDSQDPEGLIPPPAYRLITSLLL